MFGQTHVVMILCALDYICIFIVYIHLMSKLLVFDIDDESNFIFYLLQFVIQQCIADLFIKFSVMPLLSVFFIYFCNYDVWEL